MCESDRLKRRQRDFIDVDLRAKYCFNQRQSRVMFVFGAETNLRTRLSHHRLVDRFAVRATMREKIRRSLCAQDNLEAVAPCFWQEQAHRVGHKIVALINHERERLCITAREFADLLEHLPEITQRPRPHQFAVRRCDVAPR